jgi:hypothetical protein
MMATFVERGSAAGLDTSCLRRLSPPRFDTRK